MTIGQNIKELRKQKGLQQKEVATEVGLTQSNYNKIENDHRQPSIDVLTALARIFDVTVDQLLNPRDKIPQAVTVEDKTTTEKVRMIDQLDDDDKQVVYRMIDTMLTKKKFQDFFQQNIAVK
jgi:transcriptional regulator with XRE-family HTH domain